MYYKQYTDTRDLAWKILLEQNICELAVNVVEICENLQILVKYFPRQSQSDGYSMIIDGTAIIMIADDCSVERRRYTIAHEMGHILLGHVGKFRDLVNFEPKITDARIERDANMFACRLLAPACVLWALGIETPEEIAAVCQLTLEEAKYRARRMKTLCKRNKFFTSKLEKDVFKNFEPYIEKMKAKR